MLRKLVRNGCKREEYRYTLSNPRIHELCKTDNIETFVSKQQASYLGHLVRQSNKCLTKKLLFNDNKRTKAGRPIVTLEDRVLKQCNLTKDQFYKNALKKKKRHDHPNGSDRRLSSQG